MSQDDAVNKRLSKIIKDLVSAKAPVKTLDGYSRAPEDENRLNELAYATFCSASGQQFLNYMRQITLNAPLGPDADDNALRHREGMRYLFGLIHKRFEKGKNDAR